MCVCFFFSIPLAHSYQYSFAPNKRWSSFYAPAEEIGQYIHNVAEKYGALRFIQMQHEVTGCRWDDDLSKWSVARTSFSCVLFPRPVNSISH